MELLASWPFKIALFVGLLVIRLGVMAFQKSAATESGKSLRSEPAETDTGGWLDTLDSLLLTVGLVFFIVQPFILQPFYIPSGSMENTLQWTPIQDRLLVSKTVFHARDPIPGDVVVFRPPPAAAVVNTNTRLTDDFIKRCIGAPGDVIHANGNRQFFRNGKLLVEPYAKWSSGTYFSYDMKIIDGKVYSREYSFPGAPGNWQSEGVTLPLEEQERITQATPEAIPAGQYLMLGDHRSNSSDGHAWGFVPRENIVGKAMCVFWPPQRIGTLDRMSYLPQASLKASHLVPSQ